MQIQRSCCSWQDRLLLSLHREFTLLEPNGEIIYWSKNGKESCIQVLMSFLGWTRHRNQNPMIENIPGVWWNQLSLKDAKTIRDCKCLCVLAFSTKSMRTPFVEDTSLLPNYINVPSHQFCSLNCNPPNDFDKMLTSYLTIWEIFQHVWIMQDLTDKSFGHVLPTVRCYVPVKV